jgi:hypothetical protein
LFTAGVLSCEANAVCDGAICVGAFACNNGVDDDGDGHVGYPTDPGCLSPTDDDETDSCPAGGDCPACGNQIDDDLDGLTDYPADAACAAASSTSEACRTLDPVLTIVGPTTTGSTSGNTNDFTLACGLGGRDEVYALDIPYDLLELRLDTQGSAIDTVLESRGAACSASVACDDNDGPGTSSLLVLSSVTAGRYYLVVDDRGIAGSFALHVFGLIADGDSCNPALEDAGFFSCRPGSSCNGPLGNEVCVP